jgi:FKBP-type peptidyl-prolyl cis-trans isomerase SlyD
MKIAANTVVKMDYELRLDDAPEVVDASSGGEFEFLIGHENIVPGLERQLLDLVVGDAGDFTVWPAEGYGVREGEAERVPRSAFDDDFQIDVGMPVMREYQNGTQETLWVVGADGDDVLLDPNHPLAGRVLHFRVVVCSVRAATQEEIAHGHVHGPHGHHH